MARKIVITSGKGGVGKTTIAACLGKRLSKAGKKTLVLDLDSSLNNLDVVLGVEDKINYYVEDAVSGKCRAKQALVRCDDNLYIMQSARFDSGYAGGQSVRLLTEGLNDRFDFVFFDCPAGVDASFHRAVSCADEAIVVLNCYPSSIRDADKVVNLLKGYRLKSVTAVANRFRRDLLSKGKSISIEECEEILKIPIIGAISESDAVLCSEGGVLPIFSSSAAEIAKLAKRIVKEDYSSAVSSDIGKSRRKAV